MPKRSSPKKSFDMTSLFFAAVGTLLVLMVTYVLGWRMYLDGNSHLRVAKATTVSGELVFTALKPEPEDEGEVKLFVRTFGNAGWKDTGVMIPLEERAGWSWHEALPGMHYEFQAVLYIDGQEIDRTDEQFVTAPAHNVQMAMVVTWHDLPDSVDRPETTVLGGMITLNGYVPNGSVLEVYALPDRENEYEIEAVSSELLRRSQLIGTIREPEASNEWLWEAADPMEVYEVVVVLRNRGQIIGESLQRVTADAGHRMLEFTVNSTVEDPNQQADAGEESLLALGSAGGRVLGTTTTGNSTISGVVYVQGPEQEGTSLLMLWKKPGDANYQVINRYPYPAQAGTAWTWDGAQAGQTYEIMAVLQVNNANSSTAPTPITAAAPATNVNFTLNTWYVMPATPNQPSFQTCLDRSGNSWNAQISIPTVQNAQQYWVRVGTSAGTGNIWNQQFSARANNQPFIVKVPATENQQQFVQYSYATCDQCQGDDNFAPFSTPTGFTCL